MRKVIASILLIVSIVFLYKGFVEFRYMISNKAKNQSLREVATSEVVNDPLDRIIDFEKLNSINKDIKAWIYVPGTKIDYPILVGESDEEYLYNDMNKEYTPLGSIFSYSGTNFTKGNTFIFGHNMASRQMFGELRKYIDKDFLNKIVTILGIDKKLENLPGNLSGGQQQRVAIARALITKPAIILADEPTGNLDTQSSLEVMGLLKQTSERFCQTIVMITHNMNLAQMADRIIRIQDGKIIDA